jgi:hypothetical protein
MCAHARSPESLNVSATTDKTIKGRSQNVPSLWPEFPKAPPALLDNDGFFQWQQKINEWNDGIRWRLAQVSTDSNQQMREISAVSTSGIAVLTARITLEETVRASADSALATSISTVSASVATETAARIAAVTAEATARATADGFLEGKYTLTVQAGDVVTGMNITSASGGGTNVSQVIFRADKFMIYNGTSGYVMFDVSGTDVRLAGTVVVNNSGKMYIGAGNYADASTAFYVDSGGQFSLKDRLTWDGTTLTVKGIVDIGSAGDRIYIDSTGLTGGYGENVTAKINTTTGLSTGAAFTVEYSGTEYGLFQAYDIAGNRGAYLNIDSNWAGNVAIWGGSVFADQAVDAQIVTASNYMSAIGYFSTIGYMYAADNLFCGKSSVDTTTAGWLAKSTGDFTSVVNSGDVSTFVKLDADGSVIHFSRDGSTLVGSVSLTTVATSFNTSSDARMKTNFTPWSLGDAIDDIQIGEFDWSGGRGKGRGVLAQSLHAIFPDAVSAGDNGEAIVRPWGVDYGRLTIPLLAEIKSLRARVKQLEQASS